MLRCRRAVRLGIIAIPLLLGFVVLPAATASADPPGMHGHHHQGYRPPGPGGYGRGGPTYVCTSGTIPAGSYVNVNVIGVCYAPAGNVTIRGSLTVAPGALLDAVTKGDPTTKPLVPATVNIGGNVTVGQGGVFLLGCSPNITCTTPPAISYDHIQGNLTANGAEAVVLHSASIGGSVNIVGGGGGAAAETCAPQIPTTPIDTAIAPWSEDPALDFIPVYTDSEDDSVGGNFTISGLTSCWLGTLRNQIGGSANISDNTMGDPDALEIDNNLVNGNMVCLSNSPAVQFGDSGASSNLVGGNGVGECAFSVTQPNPAEHTTTTVTPPVHVTAGIQEHVTVSTRGLSASTGTFSTTVLGALTPVTTSSGDTQVAEFGNFTITGSQLNGAGTFNPTKGPGRSGFAILDTSYPNGTSSFTVFMDCHCTYAGQTGTITLRAYGTTQRNGYTSGTFLVTSGGGAVAGDLSTIAGYGTFNNGGMHKGTERLFEHLTTA